MVLVAFDRTELSTIWDLASDYLLERWSGQRHPGIGVLVNADVCCFCEGKYCNDCDNPDAQKIKSCQEILMSLQLAEFYKFR